MDSTSHKQHRTDSVAVISLSKWVERVGVAAVTAWRWRKKGWLNTVNISGRQYITQEAIEEFHRRVVAGEFAQEHKTPSRKADQHEPWLRLNRPTFHSDISSA
jgi:hypothetical protein